MENQMKKNMAHELVTWFLHVYVGVQRHDYQFHGSRFLV